jgi:hypothetical protein
MRILTGVSKGACFRENKPKFRDRGGFVDSVVDVVLARPPGFL